MESIGLNKTIRPYSDRSVRKTVVERTILSCITTVQSHLEFEVMKRLFITFPFYRYCLTKEVTTIRPKEISSSERGNSTERRNKVLGVQAVPG
jgi:hypothetical protein